jgi:choline kinase
MTHRASRHIAPAKKIYAGKGSKLSIIIASAAVGKRMKSYGPKALLSLCPGITVLDSELRTLWEAFPYAEIFVVVGFESEKIRDTMRGVYPVRFIYNPLHSHTNVMYSVSLALQACICSQLIVLHGDIVFNSQLLQNLVGNKSRLVAESNHLDPNGVGIIHQGNKVINLAYGIQPQWCQIAYLQERELELFEQVAFKTNISKNWFLYEGLKHIIDNNGEFVLNTPKNLQIKEIDSTKDWEETKKMYGEF